MRKPVANFGFIVFHAHSSLFHGGFVRPSIIKICYLSRLHLLDKLRIIFSPFTNYQFFWSRYFSQHIPSRTKMLIPEMYQTINTLQIHET